MKNILQKFGIIIALCFAFVGTALALTVAQVPQGGTGLSSVSSGNILYGKGTSPLGNDSSHTIDPATGYTNFQATIETGDTGYFTLANNWLGTGNSGVANIFSNTVGGDTILSAVGASDLTGFGLPTNNSFLLTSDQTTNNNGLVFLSPDGSGNINYNVAVSNGGIDSLEDLYPSGNTLSFFNGSYSDEVDENPTETAISFALASGTSHSSGFRAIGNGASVCGATNTEADVKSNGVIWSFPCADGSAGQALTTNGFGALGWSSYGGLTFADSVVNTSGTVTLVNDTATPADSSSYGTDDSGTLGYQVDPITIQNSTSLFSTGISANTATAQGSTFFGFDAGLGATNADDSNFLGENAGLNATAANGSNFLGFNAGDGASGADHSNFLGINAGYMATSANYSNFLGYQAGSGASAAHDSNFLGDGAGLNATNADDSTFVGAAAGDGATGANNSVFVGANAGNTATAATNSMFIGVMAGNVATSANNSNFAGYEAGDAAPSANNSNFFGDFAGDGATNASESTFLGQEAGKGAANANNSIFIGQAAGLNDTVNNSTSGYSSIVIGSGAGTGGFSNSIALGGGTVNTAANQFLINPTKSLTSAGIYWYNGKGCFGDETGSGSSTEACIDDGTAVDTLQAGVGIAAQDISGNKDLYVDTVNARTTIRNSLAITPQYATPATTDTVTSNGSSELLLNPSATIAAVTIVLPASPVDGQEFDVHSTQIIHLITWSGGTLDGATSIGPGTPIDATYSSSAGVWMN